MGSISEKVEKSSIINNDEIKNFKISFCNDNHWNKASYFCKNDKKLICGECREGMHTLHICENYDVFIKGIITKIERYLDIKKEFLTKIPSSIELHSKICEKIDNAFNEIIRQMKKHHEEFKLNLIKKVKLQFIEENKKKMEDENIFLNECINLFRSDEKRGNKRIVLDKINLLELKQKEQIAANFAIISKDIHNKINSFLQSDIQVNVEEHVYHYFVGENKQSNLIKTENVGNLINRFQHSRLVIDDDILFVCKEIDRLMQSNLNNYKLLYRASRDGFSAIDFHRCCDQKKPILIIIKSEFGKIFGGFADVAFTSPANYEYKSCERAFLFSVDKKFVSLIKDPSKAILCRKDFGPIFGSGCDLVLSSNCNINSSTKYFGYSYSLPNGILYDTPESLAFLSGSPNQYGDFKVLDYEVWDSS